TLAERAADYDRHNARAGKTDKTRLYYEHSLRYFDEFLQATGRSRVLADITLDDAQCFLDALKARQHKTLSIAARSRALRAFFHWTDARDDHRMKRLEVPRLKQASIDRVEVLEPWEIAAIERSFNLKTFSGLRDRAIAALMLDCGLRRAEVIGLELTAQQLEMGVVRVLGKGNKYRAIPFGDSTADYLRAYLAPRSSLPGDRFFVTGGGLPLTDSTMDDIMRDVRRRSGVQRVHAHLMRHTYATRFLMKNGDRIVELQRYLGHSDITMVLHYVHLAHTQPTTADRDLAPMDDLREGYRQRRPGRPKKISVWPATQPVAQPPMLRVVKAPPPPPARSGRQRRGA
ncbi:MAG: tyrosine-type recombinase/integrase, partial [Solirubrobacteraceae bacterium]